MSELRDILEEQQLAWRLVEKATAIHGINLLLFGKAGTGKTTAAMRMHASLFAHQYMMTVTEWTPANELRGFFIPKPDQNGNPGMGWQDGLAAKAMGSVTAEDGTKKIDQDNNRFIINEVDKAGPDLEAILYAICDDRSVAQINLPNGDIVNAQPGFQVIATSNEPPLALLDPIKDRFTLRIRVDLPSEEAVETLPADLQEFCLKVAKLDGDRYLSFREVKKFAELRDDHGMSPLDSAELVWGWKGQGVAEEIVNSWSLATAGA